MGCNLVTKLMAILLVEADVNANNKMINGIQMLENDLKYGFTPKEIFSENIILLTKAVCQKNVL